MLFNIATLLRVTKVNFILYAWNMFVNCRPIHIVLNCLLWTWAMIIPLDVPDEFHDFQNINKSTAVPSRRPALFRPPNCVHWRVSCHVFVSTASVIIRTTASVGCTCLWVNDSILHGSPISSTDWDCFSYSEAISVYNAGWGLQSL